MSERFVIDASVTLGWCFGDEADEIGDAALAALATASAVVPAMWVLDVSNALLVGERRGRLTAAETEQFLAALAHLPIEIDLDSVRQPSAGLLALARRHGLSAYDASCLELAQRSGLPLATSDSALRNALAEAGVAPFT